MQTYQIIIEYDGTKFSGWQIQKKDLTVQGIIQKILKKLTKKKNYSLRIRKNRQRCARNRTVSSFYN